MSTKEKALTLLRAVSNELKLGTKHYNENGKPLNTVREILEELTKGKPIQIEPAPERRNIFEGYTL